MKNTWDQIPNFDDPYAKIHTRKHSSGAEIIEVIYGAVDSAGRPTTPENSTTDRHGHWIALKLDGIYQMLYWRHPGEERVQEYGDNTFGDTLKALEKDIKEKESIINEAFALAKAEPYSSSDYEILCSRWNNLFNWNTPKEQKLGQRWQAAAERNKLAKQKLEGQTKNRFIKKELIHEAASLSNSTDWKATSAKMKELMEKWKEAGYAGKDWNDQLWKEFQLARQTFFDRQDRHFEELKSQRLQSKQKKQDLIKDARNIAQYSTDWKGTGDNLQDLLDLWKAAGSAGHEDDERLWAEFHQISDDFYSRKKAYYQELEGQFMQNRQLKGGLIAQAQGIAGAYDYSAAAAERMKDLQQRWKEIGSAGKGYNDQLWDSFRSIMDAYFHARNAAFLNKRQEWAAKTHEAIERRRQKISHIQGINQNLHDRISMTRNLDKVYEINGWIDENNARIRELEMEISEMERQLRG